MAAGFLGAPARPGAPDAAAVRLLQELLHEAATTSELFEPRTGGAGPGVVTNAAQGLDEAEVWSWYNVFLHVLRQPGHVAVQRALQAGRLRLSLAELATLRREEAAGAERQRGQAAAGLLAIREALAQRLAQQPDRFLKEVALGAHAATLTWARGTKCTSDVRKPIAPQVGAAKTLPLCLELLAPELERPMDQVRSEFIGRYVGLRGNIVRAANVAPLVTHLVFSCNRCGSEVVAPTQDGRFEFPVACPRKCKFARFAVDKDRCSAIDWQRIRLQEDFAELAVADGPPRRVPRAFDCDLREGLVGSCVPGDSVTLYGIVRHMPAAGSMSSKGEGKQAAGRAIYVLYLEVKAVVNTRQSDSKPRREEVEQKRDCSGPEFTPLQLEFIREIHQEVERLPLLTASFCQHIYGQHLVKAALLLSFLGGIPIYSGGAEKRLRRRGDIHALLLGDPGLGKSELLRALARMSPRGVYVSGNSSSVAGLTAAVVRDPSGEFALEAGALILADGGVCCIDEFDKMGADQQALLEAMEQQTVSIAKAGIVCTLPAKTTVITAANPSKGSWDMSLTLEQNLKGVMSEALLSRFDIVLLMRDDGCTQADAAVSRHILQRHSKCSTVGAEASASPADWAHSVDAELHPKRTPLSQRCAAIQPGAVLPQELLLMYLRYAKQFAHPSLSQAARRRIREVYLQRRAQDRAAGRGGGLPVTPRQLEALVRLSEARARAELRRVVLARDVEDVVEILGAGADFEARLPEEPVRKGRGRAGALADRLRQHMDRSLRRGGGRAFREGDLRAAAGPEVSGEEFDRAIRRLNEQDNVLLLKGSGIYEYTA